MSDHPEPPHTRVRPPVSWRDLCYAARDRWLASPRFQRWASAFLLTRPIARKNAQELFDLCAGFVYSQVLLACVRLKLLDHLAERPRTLDGLSQRLDMSPDATRRLLGAAVALRLAERRSEERFGLGMLGAALIGNPAVAAMIEHHALLYADLADPVALLRGESADTKLARYWPYAGAAAPTALDRDAVAAYSTLMSVSQCLVAEDILDAYPLGQRRCLLDVGGGEGMFLRAAAARAPSLKLVLFDLPEVAERARLTFHAAGLAGRARAVGGDFLSDPLPEGADAVSLVRVILDHDDTAALKILTSIHRILPKGGVLVIAEPLSGARGAERVSDAYFAFYLLAMGKGRTRTICEHRALLSAAGFREARQAATPRPLQTGLIVARA